MKNTTKATWRFRRIGNHLTLQHNGEVECVFADGFAGTCEPNKKTRATILAALAAYEERTAEIEEGGEG